MKTFLIIYIILSIVSFIFGIARTFTTRPNTASREWAKTFIYLGLICFNASMVTYLIFFTY